MEYTYNIPIQVYDWIKSGKKDIEIRILKEKSNNIQVGDYITFNNQDIEGKYIKVQVIFKEIFNDVDSLLEAYDINRMMPDHSKEELKELLFQIYGDSLKDGKLVAFGFKYLSSD